MTAFCDNNWYGNGCEKNCVAQDSCDGHYTCDLKTGNKVCLPGFSGPKCDVPDLNLVGCSVEQGRPLLIEEFRDSSVRIDLKLSDRVGFNF